MQGDLSEISSNIFTTSRLTPMLLLRLPAFPAWPLVSRRSLPCFAYSKPTVTAERHTSSHGAPVPSTRSDTGSNWHSHHPGVASGTGAPAAMDDRSMMTIGEESDDVELRLAIEASRAV
jgi:hypothetical protein